MKDNTNKIIVGIALLTAILTLIPIIFYYNYFPYVSTNTNDWANLGSYFGGILTPIYSFLSFVFIVWISILVYQRDKKYNKKQLEIPRIKALNELRLQRIHDFRKKLGDNDTVEVYYSFKNFILLDMIIADFLLSSTHLFDNNLLNIKSIKFQMYARILDQHASRNGSLNGFYELKEVLENSTYSNSIDFEELDKLNEEENDFEDFIHSILNKYHFEKEKFISELESFTISEYENVYV